MRASKSTSASMIAIGGGFALLGNAERLAGLAGELTLETAPIVVWEIKLIVMLLFATNAFLKFVWAHRLFGYAAVLMARSLLTATKLADPLGRIVDRALASRGMGFVLPIALAIPVALATP